MSWCCLNVSIRRSGSIFVRNNEASNSADRYGTKYFPDYAEEVDPNATSYKALQKMAKSTRTYLIGGSIPERHNDKLYNTSLVFSPIGELIATHRKVHLFDIDIPGKIKFKESEVLSPGNKLTTFDTQYGKLGLAICYDVRFPEMAMTAAREGCAVMIYPG